jgi:hypothetical protein
MGSFDGDPGLRPTGRVHVASAAVWEPIPDDGLIRLPGPLAGLDPRSTGPSDAAQVLGRARRRHLTLTTGNDAGRLRVSDQQPRGPAASRNPPQPRILSTSACLPHRGNSDSERPREIDKRTLRSVANPSGPAGPTVAQATLTATDHARSGRQMPAGTTGPVFGGGSWASTRDEASGSAALP